MTNQEILIVVKGKDLAAKTFKGVQKELGETTKRVFNLRNALIGLAGAYGLQRVAKSFLEVGTQLEQFETQLTAVLDGNRQLAQETLKWVREFAAYTPFMTDEVVRAFVMLQSVGISVTKEMMTTIGDVAYVFNRRIEDVASALISFETEVLRRLGIEIDRTGKQAIIASGNVRVAVANDAAEIRKALLEVWAKRFPGAMKEAEEDWRGMVALLKSQWYEFKAAVMEAGVFEFIKTGLRMVVEKINELKEQGRLDEWAKSWGDVFITVLQAVAYSVGVVLDAFMGLKTVVLGIRGLWSEEAREQLRRMREEIEKYGTPMERIHSAIEELKARLETVKTATDDAASSQQRHKQAMADAGQEARTLAKEIKIVGEALGSVGQRPVAEGVVNMRALLPKLRTQAAELERAINDDLLTEVEKRKRYYIEEYELRIRQLEHFLLVGAITEEKYTELTHQALEALKKGLSEVESTTEGAFDFMATVADEAARSMQRSLSDFFFTFMKGEVDSFKDLWESFTNSLLRIWSDALAKMVMDWLDFDNMLSSGKGGGGGGGGSIWGTIGSVLGGVFNWVVSLFEKGGTIPGGFLPVRQAGKPFSAYQSGGIVERPTLGLIGEGGQPEAVVPLPDGRSIPVKLHGERGQGITVININAVDAKSFEDLCKRNPGAILSPVIENLKRSGTLRYVIKEGL